MYTISKQFTFSASHQLLNMDESHQCYRLHGHNYIVEVELQAEQLNKYGFVRDYHDLDALKKYIDSTLDHRHLNEVFGHDDTTAELWRSFCTIGQKKSGLKSAPCALAKHQRLGLNIAHLIEDEFDNL